MSWPIGRGALLALVIAISILLVVVATSINWKKERAAYLKVVKYKSSFQSGEEVKLLLYLVNQEALDLDAPSLSYQVEIYGSSGPIIGLARQDLQTGPVRIPANSEYKIGEFVWDQRDSQGNQVGVGAYTIRIKLLHLNLETSIVIQIQ